MLALGAGIWHVWSPLDLDGYSSNYNVDVSEFFGRTYLLIVTVGALELAALGFSILGRRIRARRISRGFLTVLFGGVVTFAIAMLMLAIACTFPHRFFDWSLYWRVFTAMTVASVILILIPLLARSLAPQGKPPAISPGMLPGMSQPPVPGYFAPPTQSGTPRSRPGPAHFAPPATAPAAGWYVSENPTAERYWDGAQWTNHTRPKGYQGR